MTPTPFISVTDLGNYLGRDFTTDPGALAAVDSACDICRDIAERDFNLGTATVTLDGTGTDALPLPPRKLPANTVSAVQVAGSAIMDYTVSPNRDMLYRGTVTPYVDSDTELPTGVWPAGRQNVSVTLTHGYAPSDIPRSVAMVALSIASRLIVQGPALQETVGNVSVRYGTNATDLTRAEQAILRKYRRT